MPSIVKRNPAFALAARDQRTVRVLSRFDAGRVAEQFTSPCPIGDQPAAIVARLAGDAQPVAALPGESAGGIEGWLAGLLRTGGEQQSDGTRWFACRYLASALSKAEGDKCCGLLLYGRQTTGDSRRKMLTTNPFDDDKLREECGIFGIWGAENASSFVALGLHALQHRGQEAAGIVSFDGTNYHAHRAMGHVAGNFDRDDIIRKLSGKVAIGHVRYSTTGETALRNVQPLFADLAEGGFAVAHNGNLSNAMTLRAALIRRGSIFQSTSDTEVIIHLVATSSYSTPLDRLTDALSQVEGAYSLLCLTPEGLVACRDPLGIRPLVMGKLGEATIFASETVALDVIGATYLRDVEPGELIIVNEAGVRSFRPFAPAQPAPLHLRACLFLAARQHRRGHLGL